MTTKPRHYIANSVLIRFAFVFWPSVRNVLGTVHAQRRRVMDNRTKSEQTLSRPDKGQQTRPGTYRDHPATILVRVYMTLMACRASPYSSFHLMVHSS